MIANYKEIRSVLDVLEAVVELTFHQQPATLQSQQECTSAFDILMG